MIQNKTGKKKIIFLITGSGVGGAEVLVKNIIFNIDQDKFLPILVSMRPLGKIGEEVSQYFKVISLGAGKKFNPLFLWRFFYLLKKEKPDILHCHLFHANLIGRIVGKTSKVPYIISTIHSDNFGGKLRYFLLKITDSLNNITVVVSQKIKDDLIKRKIISENKVRLIYNGVKENKNILNFDNINKLKNDLEIDRKSPIILSVGRLKEVKGHIYLIRAIKTLKIKQPNLKLLIIGDGPERKRLTDEISKLGLNNTILLLGEIRETNLYYKLADILVQPSINEGLPLVLIEAMSNKLLVVASRVGGIPEIVKNGINGFTANPKDPENLAIVINQVLLLNYQEKEKIVFNAYEDFKNKFSLEKMMENYYEVYSKIF